MKGPLIIGHRGAAGHAPENTKPSFEAGLRLGAGAVECDVHLSKDGELVVIHDETLERCTSGAGRVKDLPWSALRRLDAGSWFAPKFKGARLWRLEDLLRWAKPKKTRAGEPLRVVVEIKNAPVRYPGIARAVVERLRKARFMGRAVVISFDHGVVRQTKRLAPDLFAGILFSRPFRGLAARMAWTGADAVFPRHTFATPAFMKAARRKGWFVGVWTADAPADVKRLARAGVDAVATNFPDRMASPRRGA